MTNLTTTPGDILVAIDIAKAKHDVLIEDTRSNRRRRLVIRNCREDFEALASNLQALGGSCTVALEPTADYHRNIAYYLRTQGFELRLVSSIAVARTREALHNSWDKNDPKDAQVILHLMRTGITQYFYDPVIGGTNDLQELSKTYFQISLRKTRIQHSLLNHYVPLYFPEVERYLCSTRAGWFAKLLIEFPTPASVVAFSEEDFVTRAARLVRTKHSKQALLRDMYSQAKVSVAIPVDINSKAVETFRLILREYLDLNEKRANLEDTAHALLKDNADYKILRSVPGIGPILALTILAEAGKLRRFRHERQFLKFCGLDLSTSQSGYYRGSSQISKRGNGRLRTAMWMAATIASRMQDNSIRRKFDRYVGADPKNGDLRRRAYTACAAKMARLVYGLIKHETLYRSYFEENSAVINPGGRTRSNGPLRQTLLAT